MTHANTSRVDATWERLQSWHSNGHCHALAAETGSVTGETYSFSAGQLAPENATAVTSESIFLIASPTKPFVAIAAMMLLEQGKLQLDQRVQRYLPDFRSGGKESIRLIHLLTHTSGLPDMLPNNEQLRQAHAPLSEFMKHVYKVDLVAAPGTCVHYQSKGILALAVIIEKITGMPLSEYLETQIFAPLNMANTALGIPDSWHSTEQLDKMTWSQVDEHSAATDWGWNSLYWRRLGAPWGGLLSSAHDLGSFCQHLLEINQGRQGIISPQSLSAMTSNQLTNFPALTESVVRTTPWGLGWQLNWPGHPRGFGSLLPREVFGHWGATGTMLWLDPTRNVYGVVLTTEPIKQEDRRQILFGNLSSLVWQPH